MASKTERKNAAVGQQSAAPQIKDDGSKWIVVHAETGKQVYLGSGVSRAEAERLGTGLVGPTAVMQVS